MMDSEREWYDCYGARNYSDPDDFYDSHYEDFGSYEEAEDYFCDHHPDGDEEE